MKNKRQKHLYQALYENVRQKQIGYIILKNEETNRYEIGSLYQLNAAEFLYLNKFWLWLLDYTAGVAISELAIRFSEIVDAFVSWHEISKPFWKKLNDEKPERKLSLESSPVDFDNQTCYQDFLQFISVAILLRDYKSIARIIEVMQSHRNRDNLYEQLIENYVSNPLSFKRLDHKKTYTNLNESFYEVDSEKIIELIKKYLKYWYSRQNGARWYNSHNRINDDYAPHYGYWAFEAGAACYLLDVDDSSIDSIYYPKDLVDYGRKLREEGKYTSI